VVALDNLSTGDSGVLPPDVPLHVGDIADTTLVARLLAQYRPRAVMHFAASTSVPESMSNPLKYYDNNVAGTRALVQACIDGGVSLFLFSSSAAVYGAPRKLPLDESAPTLPINPYGQSKLMGEAMLADAASAAGLRWAALRYFNVAGADASGRSGPMGTGSTNLIKSIAELAAGRREAITLYGDDYPTTDGTCVRDFIHVADIAEAHALVLDHLAGGGDSTIVNCGYGHGYSVREVLTAAERIAGPFNILSGPRRPGDPPILVADSSRIRRLGWTPQKDDLGEMLRSAIAWERR
jgi:UDP-glucose 4-epimerase